jgi:hypothetical protein
MYAEQQAIGTLTDLDHIREQTTVWPIIAIRFNRLAYRQSISSKADLDIRSTFNVKL